MTASLAGKEGFAIAIIDALSSHICVIDEASTIVAVNRAWRKFTSDNPPLSAHSEIGENYLKVCRGAVGLASEGAEEFALGIEAVLGGKSDIFELEYACHAPDENRWFLGTVTPLVQGPRGAVISHATITERKLLEFDLLRLATTDPLTGLSNRRYFFDVANLEVERVRRFGGAASLVMVDLDRFKAVNDIHGHHAGDEALRFASQVLRGPLRQVDTLSRIGGEEFVMLLPHTDEVRAAALADKLRGALSLTPVSAGRHRFTITASFGVAEIRSTDSGIDEALARADAALYAAKRAGRNRVMRFALVPREAQSA